jgi:hypothetical protein
MKKTTKTTAGHRCKGLSVSTRCECGWSSGSWCGPGARKNAYAEWRNHVESHKKDDLCIYCSGPALNGSVEIDGIGYAHAKCHKEACR